MTEEQRPIEGYEDLYAVTKSGRIITLKNNKPRVRCKDEYGFPKVHLSKNGERKHLNVFKIWEKAFPELDKSEFKGALKDKYGKGGILLNK